jgi:nucleotide-binding universal stress UspA family protein
MATTSFRRILVPHDFSVHATRALRVAADLAGPRGRLLVLHVVHEEPPISELPIGPDATWKPPTAVVDQARRELVRIVQMAVRRGGPRADCRVALGDPLERILAAANEADVIVMATRGRSGLAHLLIGSVAEKVVRHSPIPVLTIRPAARAVTVAGRASPAEQRRARASRRRSRA